MQHEAHLSDHSEVGVGARIFAAIIVVAAILGIGTYVVYGSGMWAPVAQHETP